MPTQYTRTIRDVYSHNFRSTTTNKIARQTTLPLPIAGSLMAIKSGTLYNLFYADGVTWFKLTGSGSPAAGLPGVLVINNNTGGRDIRVTSGDDIVGVAELDLLALAGPMALTSTGPMGLTSSATIALLSGGTTSLTSGGAMSLATTGAGSTMGLTSIGTMTLSTSGVGSTMSLTTPGSMGISSTLDTMFLTSTLGMTLTSTTSTMALSSDGLMTLTSTSGGMDLLSDLAMTLTSTMGILTIGSGVGGISIGTTGAIVGTSTVSTTLISTGLMSLGAGSTMTLTSVDRLFINSTGADVDLTAATTMALTSTLGMTLTTTGAGTTMTLTTDSGEIKLASGKDITLEAAEAAGDSINLVTTGDGGFTIIRAKAVPTGAEEPILEIRGDIAGRGSHLRSIQVGVPVVSTTGGAGVVLVGTTVTDMAGVITLGNSAPGGVAATFTVEYDQDYTTVPSVVVTPTPGNGAGVGVTPTSFFISAFGVDEFTVDYITPLGPVATLHGFNYHVIEV